MLRSNLEKLFICGVAGALICGISTTAWAQKRSTIPGKFSSNVTFASEYYFRGLSQTDDAPAIQGGFDYEIEVARPTTVYLGTWASNVDFNEGGGVDGAAIEIDLYGGLKGTFGPRGITWEVGAIYYAYPGADSVLNYDFWEIKAAIGTDFGFAAVTASLNYSTDFFAGSGEAYYPKVAVTVPVPGVNGLVLSGHLAEQDVENNVAFGTENYLEWNLGLSYKELFGLFDVSVAYSDTDISPDTEGKEEAIILTVGRRF